ncbi:hypothetical protein BRADI_2g13035v3 [Brachypodium distachyon]|uniref:Uncharacterized protein n=1 Tax=Brachypodium distachyon TaxID=15368 RepID=A0A0Q3FY11_BRADI|nr:hypothetical protein BRADI_2g13035v3 [Brachypodium distachyon]
MQNSPLFRHGKDSSISSHREPRASTAACLPLARAPSRACLRPCPRLAQHRLLPSFRTGGDRGEMPRSHPPPSTAATFPHHAWSPINRLTSDDHPATRTRRDYFTTEHQEHAAIAKSHPPPPPFLNSAKAINT